MKKQMRNKMQTTKILLISISLSFFGILKADDHIEISAMEGIQCNFQDGKDMDDAMKVISEWNDYGDENFSEPYSAWILTPVYRTNSDFDFVSRKYWLEIIFFLSESAFKVCEMS